MMSPQKPWKTVSKKFRRGHTEGPYQPRNRNAYKKHSMLSLLGHSYRRYLLLGVGLVAVFGILGTVLVGFTGYYLATGAKEQVSAWVQDKDLTSEAAKVVGSAKSLVENGQLDSPLLDQPTGFIGGVFHSYVEGWLAEAIRETPLAQVKTGLACFDAIGGPSAQSVIGSLKERAIEPWLGKLEKIEQGLSLSSAPSGPQACAQWLLNS